MPIHLRFSTDFTFINVDNGVGAFIDSDWSFGWRTRPPWLTIPYSCVCVFVFMRVSVSGESWGAERLGNRAINQKVAVSIPGRAKLICVLGQGTSPYLFQGGMSLYLL